MIKNRSEFPEYATWLYIRRRCYSKNAPEYVNYGGRGIRVSKEWLASFEAFFADMGKKPSSFHQIDRIDNNGDYSKSNCKWSSPKENSRNKRSSRFFEIKGQSKTLAEWCEINNLKHNTVLMRINKYGWDTEKALTHKTPGGKR